MIEGNTGLATAMLPPEIQRDCAQVHSAFLAKHDMPVWMLAVTGLSHPHPAVSATSNPPDGTEGTTEEITLTLDFSTDWIRFLDRQHSEWLRRKSN